MTATFDSPEASTSNSAGPNDHAQNAIAAHGQAEMPAEHPVIAALRDTRAGGKAVPIKGYSGGLVDDSFRIYRSLDVDTYVDVPTHAVLNIAAAESDGRVQLHVRESARVTLSLVVDVSTMVGRLDTLSASGGRRQGGGRGEGLPNRPLGPSRLGRRKLGFFESCNACLENACNEVGGIWEDGVGCKHRQGVDDITAAVTEFAYGVEVQGCNPVWRTLSGLWDRIWS